MEGEGYFDHDADIGIIGKGKTLESCFCNGALLIFALMADLSQVQHHVHIHFEFVEKDAELAFVIWINLLIAKAQINNVIFSKFKLKHQKDKWWGDAWGEKWHPGLTKGIDVKGATLTSLAIKKENNQWKVTCIVDV